ncbi:MAG TPA: carboxypeptidase-like regulatory domain-containing protein [Bryobacteraceae bacterium]|nr:carboxypeptidase-like regulatory domain-containing protein [Bryobacteraceae bacterium]
MNSLQIKLRVVFAALLICCAPLAFSQTITTGDVTGVISDASGAVVPSSIVTLKNTDTNETRTAVTNESGHYRFSLLAPGSYTISAATTGLKSNTDKITVSVGQEQAINLTLTVQGTQEVVEVKAEAAVIQTENANLASEISHAQIVALPMNGGDLTTVAFTVPGVRMNVGGGNGNFNANGIPLTSVLFTINGADVMDPYNNLNNSGASNNLLGANEVAEAAVVLNAYSPSYGRMAAAQVNIVGKTGTNSFHGNAIYNYNDAIFNANSYLNNSTGTARGRSDANLYAGSIGGPVRKNKTFFFFDTEALRYALPSSGVVSIPSPQLEQYALAHAVPSAIPVYQQAIALWNSATGLNRAVPVTNGGGPLQDSNGHLGCGTHTFGNATSGDPFVNGSSGQRFGIDVPCALAFATNNSSVNVENLLIARVDHTLTDKQKLDFRYEYDWGLQATSTSPISHLFDSKSSQPQHQGQMTYTYVINPRLVNTFTGQSSWYTAIFGVQDFAATQAAIPVRLSLGDGGANGGGFAALGAGFPTGRNVGQLQLIDDLSYIRGSHTLKFGVNYRYNKVTDTSLSSGTIAGSYSLKDIADFASGVVNGSNQGSSFSQSYPLIAAAHIRVASLDLYAADEWAVRKNVKIQYGIRLEHDRNPECADNCFSRLNVPFLQSGYQAGSNVPYNATIQTGLSTAYNHYQAVVYEPRLGIVFTPFGSGKTVVRTGVGLFSNLPSASTVSSIFGNAPEKFTPSVTFGNVGLQSDSSTSQAIALASFNTFESSFAKGFTLSQIQSALGKVPFAAPGYYSTPDEFRPPKVVEWSFEVEQPLTQRNVLAVTYSGNHGYDETYNNTTLNNFNANPSKFPAGFLGLPLAAADPRFTTITQVLLSGYSNYNGLSVQLRHAFSYGFSGQMGYTWSHGLQLGGVYDPRNLNFGYSNSGLDNRHNFTADLLWTMPKLRNNLLERVAGGWTVGVKAFAFTGRPFSVTNGQLGGQVNANFSGTILADLVDPTALGKHCGSGAWNTPCLTQSQFLYTTTAACNGATNGCLTAQGDYGNVPPNSFYGPGYFDIDTQVTKRVRITERANFEIGASAYNTLNHPNFGQPSGTATSASIGKITGTVSPPVSIYGSGQGAFVSGRVLVVTGKFNF